MPVVRQQVEQIILNLFTLKDGSFEFKEMPLPPDEVITLKLSPTRDARLRAWPKLSGDRQCDSGAGNGSTYSRFVSPVVIMMHG